LAAGQVATFVLIHGGGDVGWYWHLVEREPPEFMREVVADRLGVIPDEIAAGHAVALSHPKELASLLVSYSATGG
jgi:hypothetical protein